MTSTISPPLPPPTNRQKRPHLNPPFSVKSVNNPANLQQHIHFIILHIIGSGKVYLQVNIFTQLLLNAVGLTFILSSISLYAQLSHNLSKYICSKANLQCNFETAKLSTLLSPFYECFFCIGISFNTNKYLRGRRKTMQALFLEFLDSPPPSNEAIYVLCFSPLYHSQFLEIIISTLPQWLHGFWFMNGS